METQKTGNLLNNSDNENLKFATTKKGILLTVNQVVIIQKMKK